MAASSAPNGYIRNGRRIPGEGEHGLAIRPDDKRARYELLRKTEILFEKSTCPSVFFFIHHNNLRVVSAEPVPVDDSLGVEVEDLLCTQIIDWVARMRNQGNAVQGKCRQCRLARSPVR